MAKKRTVSDAEVKRYCDARGITAALTPWAELPWHVRTTDACPYGDKDAHRKREWATAIKIRAKVEDEIRRGRERS